MLKRTSNRILLLLVEPTGHSIGLCVFFRGKATSGSSFQNACIRCSTMTKTASLVPHLLVKKTSNRPPQLTHQPHPRYLSTPTSAFTHHSFSAASTSSSTSSRSSSFGTTPPLFFCAAAAGPPDLAVFSVEFSASSDSTSSSSSTTSSSSPSSSSPSSSSLSTFVGAAFVVAEVAAAVLRFLAAGGAGHYGLARDFWG